MPRLEAPSIFLEIYAGPPVISRQDRQALQGSAAGPLSQLRALAMIRAKVVLPVPRTPLKIRAWGTRFAAGRFAGYGPRLLTDNIGKILGAGFSGKDEVGQGGLFFTNQRR